MKCSVLVTCLACTKRDHYVRARRGMPKVTRGRATCSAPSTTTMFVVVPVFGSTADEGEALSTAARPAQLCSPVGRAADTLVGCVVEALVGNPRSFLQVPVSFLVEIFFIINAQCVVLGATLRTLCESPSVQTSQDWTTKYPVDY